MAIWSSWLPDILPHVSQCPIPMIEHELKRAAQTFFSDSRAWQVTKTPVAVAATVADISVFPDDAEQELVRIESARWNGAPLEPKTADSMDSGYVDDWRAHTGSPVAFIQITPGTIRLYPVPLDAGTLALRVSVRPSESATGIPDNMAVRFRDTLATGAKSRLMLYQGKPWSSPDMGLALAVSFRSGIDSAAAASARAYGSGRIASKPNWF